MWNKSKKKEIDEQLLQAMTTSKQEWEKMQLIIEESIEPKDRVVYQEKLFKAKFLFLLRQARKRNIHAIRLF